MTSYNKPILTQGEVRNEEIIKLSTAIKINSPLSSLSDTARLPTLCDLYPLVQYNRS